MTRRWLLLGPMRRVLGAKSRFLDNPLSVRGCRSRSFPPILPRHFYVLFVRIRWWMRISSGAAVLCFVPGCNTGAIAVKECRELEYARCEASLACGTIEDVEACRRFYRDQCLHGIAGGQAPTTEEQNKCVKRITRAGICAQDDPDMALSACLVDGMGGGAGAPSLTGPSVCEVVAKPWDGIPACGFIDEPAAMGGDKG